MILKKRSAGSHTFQDGHGGRCLAETHLREASKVVIIETASRSCHPAATGPIQPTLLLHTWFLKVLGAVILLEPSSAWTDGDRAALKRWFGAYLHRLQTSSNGLD